MGECNVGRKKLLEEVDIEFDKYFILVFLNKL